MSAIPIQLGFEDVNDEYKAFVEKFKPKKTTDDCYTPKNVYEAIKTWVCKEYGINPDMIVRPFWPGGNYERFPYKKTDVVVDNPPFSIISQIVKFYITYGIPFFLFAPYLSNFNLSTLCTHIIAPATITYENKAEVSTSFLTNMDRWLVRTSPELLKIIEKENKKNLKKIKKQLPKYVYPNEVLTTTMAGYMCTHGIEYKLAKENAFFIKELDSQKNKNKAIFGGGFLLSEKAAAEKAAAEKAAAEKAAAVKWTLSDREKEIVMQLGKGVNDNH